MVKTGAGGNAGTPAKGQGLLLLEELLKWEEVLNTRSFSAFVVVLAHVSTLARQDLKVVRVVVSGVAVLVVYDLTGLERPTELPLSNSTMLIVELALGVPSSFVTCHYSSLLPRTETQSV